MQVFTLGTSGTSSSLPSMLDWLAKNVLKTVAFSLLEQWILPKASIGEISFVEKPFFDIKFLTSFHQFLLENNNKNENEKKKKTVSRRKSTQATFFF